MATRTNSIATLLRSTRDEVLRVWTEEASRAAAARGLSQPDFENLLVRFLDALSDERYDLGTFSGRPREILVAHLSTRLRQGFQLAEIVDELRALGECIVTVATRRPESERPSAEQKALLFRELQLASIAVAELFGAHMREEEQLEKRYRRLIQAAVTAASQPDPSSLRAGLEDVLSLVMEAMGAQSAALLLFDARTERLELASAVGLAKDAMSSAIHTLRSSSFLGRIARSENTTAVLDAATTPLEVNGALRRSGIHSLLGVRLPPRHALVGVLYIGVTAVRPFSPREASRLESLGEQLTLHLDSARLFTELREERELREQTISMIAHDLRGPLAAAKAASQMLSQMPASAPGREELATRVQRNIDRADRMLRDLLDVRRLNAGEGLEIDRRLCDLGVVARDVVEELRDQYGDRFQLRVEGDVRGYCSADELHRSLWNLATNAVKYGAKNAPIIVRVEGEPDRLRISVHNEGTPIAEGDRAGLFQPFRRSRAARAGSPSGWGLGLSLVRASAEAHGGTVRVESNEHAGTTFTIELPRDVPRMRAHARAGSERGSIPSTPA